MKRLLPLAAILMVAAISGCGGNDSSPAADDPPLKVAYDKCVPIEQKVNKALFHGDAPAIDEVIQYKSGSVLVTTPEPQGDLLATSAFGAAQCILEQTEAPPSILQAMGSATALGGRQSDTYADIKVGWSFNGSDPSSFEATFDPTS